MAKSTRANKAEPQPDTGAVLRMRILTALGVPPGLYQVNVLPLWRGFFRVNVLIGPDASAVRVAHSYFVEAGEDGSVVSSSPPLVRLYP